MLWPRTRMVRLHMDGDRPSVEGIWTGMLEGHYVLKKSRLIVAAEGQPHDMGEVYVPASKVLLMQKVSA